MTPRITFFPVGNGDMTLIELESGRKILADIRIRDAADDPDDETPDVAALLRQRLVRDGDGRLFVDAFLLSHPDEDHCRGLRKHFHLGPPANWSKSSDKIFIREIWSSPVVFRRASRNHVLCDDASAFTAEARRRVQRFRDLGAVPSEGDRILILGEDEDGKTDDLTEILVTSGSTFSRINAAYDPTMVTRLLAPTPPTGDSEEEEDLGKNGSSTILQIQLSCEGRSDAGVFLTGGDAEVAIWDLLWDLYSNQPTSLSYNLLQTPHHCSWHSLSYDSWSELGEDAEVSEPARNALGQALAGSYIVASSKPIKDDDSDPPCVRAKREYEVIANNVGGLFRCVGEHPSETAPDVMEFEITRNGPRLVSRPLRAPAIIGSGALGRQPLPHGSKG